MKLDGGDDDADLAVLDKDDTTIAFKAVKSAMVGTE